MVKKGSSTVKLKNGAYTVVDTVSTYHPTGEVVPNFRYSRDLMLDFNVYYGYFLLEEIHVVGHVIAEDDDDVDAEKVIKPKMWLGIQFNYAKDLARRGLIAKPEFMTASLLVNIGTSNPQRLETFFRYKRTGIGRISSTTAEAGFNFGS